MSLDIARIRAEFPALAITDSGRKRIYFDSPGGTQTPKSVIDRTVDCLVRSNANLGGPFATSIAAGKLAEGPMPPWPICWAQPRPPRSSSART